MQSKKGCKDKESIQSSTTPDPGYQWESDKLTVSYRLWPYNLRMPIFKRFSLIESLVISEMLVKFHEKMKFKTFIVGPSRKVNFELYTIFLFVWVKCSTFTLKLNKISRFKMVTKKFDELVIFYQNFGRSVQLSSSFGKTFSYVRDAC